jgi:hypothetical protein
VLRQKAPWGSASVSTDLGMLIFSDDFRRYVLLESLFETRWKYVHRKWAISDPKLHFTTQDQGIENIVKRELPAGMWPRRQRSGTVYYYYSFDRKEKEIALGNDLPAAIARYHKLEIERLTASFTTSISMIQIITQFERCEPHPEARHAVKRRSNELKLLNSFFAEIGSPSMANIGSQSEYETWLRHRNKATGFDSIRLLRAIWRFAQRYGYVANECPWTPTSQQKERVNMEIADVLLPYSETELHALLEEILNPRPAAATNRIPTESLPENFQKSLDGLEFELDIAKLAALRDLRDSYRDDLARALQNITVQHLVDLLTSSTRLMHVPPGTIDLTARRRNLISDLH